MVDDEAQADTNAVINAIDTIADVRAAQAADRAFRRGIWTNIGNTLLLFGVSGWVLGQQFGAYGVVGLLAAIVLNVIGAKLAK